MAKYIKLTQEMIEQAREEFYSSIRSTKMSDGKIVFTKTFNAESRKAVISFTANAYSKMIRLIKDFDKEVAWHGIAERLDGDEYLISDILVFPQEVTGATVNTDQVEYQNWLIGLEDDVFNKVRFHGHSHVNMGVSPSSVDTTHREKIIEQLRDDMFYIFMIWNKSMQFSASIYDMSKNILFETSDVEVKLYSDTESLDEFINNAKVLVKNKTYTTYSNSTVSNKPVETTAAASKSSSAIKESKHITHYYEDIYGNKYDDDNYYCYDYSRAGGWHSKY